jgi:hypothetical protein
MHHSETTSLPSCETSAQPTLGLRSHVRGAQSRRVGAETLHDTSHALAMEQRPALVLSESGCGDAVPQEHLVAGVTERLLAKIERLNPTFNAVVGL